MKFTQNYFLKIFLTLSKFLQNLKKFLAIIYEVFTKFYKNFTKAKILKKAAFMAKKFIDIMDTSFRDGFQSVFGARVLMEDFFPAVEAACEAGITHFEFGGGARFQSLYFYLNEDAFEMMDKFRAIVGKKANLQTLAGW